MVARVVFVLDRSNVSPRHKRCRQPTTHRAKKSAMGRQFETGHSACSITWDGWLAWPCKSLLERWHAFAVETPSKHGPAACSNLPSQSTSALIFLKCDKPGSVLVARWIGIVSAGGRVITWRVIIWPVIST